MRTDAELKDDVIDELVWDSRVNETGIGVAVKSGIVTLSGEVNAYSEKIAAEKAAKRVIGVKAVVMEIEVKISGSDERTDVDIAKVAVNNIKWNSTIPKDKVLVKVENAWVTLEGKVDWNYQKEAAKKAVQNLFGVKGVSNLIEVKSSVEPSLVKDNIKKSFERNALLDAEKVNVQVEGHKVILSGSVTSWNEQKQANDAAWSAPGVWKVEDKLTIKTPELV